MQLYNSLSHKKEEFVPNHPDIVKMYTCGPTVYHFAHIGNLRTYIMEDVLKKYLRYQGYPVKRVMNITDVGHLSSDADTGEDKMLKGARREHKTVMEIAKYYTDAFFVSCGAGQAAVFRPAAIAVHDDADGKSLGKFFGVCHLYLPAAGLPCKKCRAPFTSARHLPIVIVCCGSDGHDLLLLFFHGSINVLDILIGQLLDILFHGLLAVLGQLAGLLHGLSLIHSIAAHVAHSNLGVFAQLGDFLSLSRDSTDS